MKRFILAELILFSLMAGEVWGQPEIIWSRNYGFVVGEVYCSSLIQMNNGDFIIAGTVIAYDRDSTDFIILRVNLDGDSLWLRRFGSRYWELCNDAILSRDNNLLLAGSRDYGRELYDFWLVCVSEQGDSLWSRTYGDQRNDECSAIVQTSDGGLALGGTYGGYRDEDYFWLLRTNEQGDSLWSTIFNSGSKCYSIVQTSNNGFALAGFAFNNNRGNDLFLARLDEDGNIIWTRYYGSYLRDACWKITETTDHGFALVGTQEFSVEPSNYNIWLIRTDEEGDSLWSRTFDFSEWDICSDILQTEDDGFMLVGSASGKGLIVRTDATGDSLWSMIWVNENNSCFNSIVQAEEGGYILAGSINGDFWLVKTGPDPVSAPASPLILHHSSLILSKPYPNPFNGTLSLSFRTASPGKVALELIDPRGRKVARLFEGFVPAGERRVAWNGAGMPAGSYFIALNGNRNEKVIQKIILEK